MLKLAFVATLLAHANCQDTAADATCKQQPIIQNIYSSSDFPAITVESNNHPNVAQGRPGRIGPEGPRGFKGSKVGDETIDCRKFVCLVHRIPLQPEVICSTRTHSGKWCLLNVFLKNWFGVDGVIIVTSLIISTQITSRKVQFKNLLAF